MQFAHNTQFAQSVKFACRQGVAGTIFARISNIASNRPLLFVHIAHVAKIASDVKFAHNVKFALHISHIFSLNNIWDNSFISSLCR